MKNIKTVSKLLGIPTSTIRTWEQRYHIVNPVRTPNGHRLYTQQDMNDLRWIKHQIENNGMTISQAVHLLKQKRHEEPLQYPYAEQEKKEGGNGFQTMIGQVYDTLVSLDVHKAQKMLDYCFSMFYYEDVFDEILFPVLVKMGEEWRMKKISVAEEHFASHLISQRFFHLFRIFPIYPSFPKMMAFCPLGEHHQIGLLRFTLFLRKHGVEVIYIGANNPYEGIKRLISTHDIQIIILSLTNPKLIPHTQRMIEDILADFPKIKFALGGRAFQSNSHDLQQWLLPANQQIWLDWLDRILHPPL